MSILKTNELYALIDELYTALFYYGAVTNSPQIQCLKTTQIYSFTAVEAKGLKSVSLG